MGWATVLWEEIKYIVFYGFLFYALLISCENIVDDNAAIPWWNRFVFSITFLLCLFLLAHILHLI